MTPLGLLAFFGMAVVSVDVLGGIIAGTLLARGLRPVHLLAFVGGYALAVLVVTLALKPILAVVGGWLAPLLGSAIALGVAQLLIGLALIAVGIHQRRSAVHPSPPPMRPMRDRVGSLAVGGLLLALTTFADPTFTVAVGMATQAHPVAVEAALLVVWNIIYQAPLVAVTVAALFGKHERVLQRLGELASRHRRRLLTIIAIALAVIGLTVATDAVVALSSAHRPWLQSILMLDR